MTTTSPHAKLVTATSLQDLKNATFEDLQKVLSNTSKIVLKCEDSNTLPSIMSFKKEAKELREKENLSSHVTALNTLAKKYGYKNFNTIKPYLQKEDNSSILDCKELKEKILSFDKEDRKNGIMLIRKLIAMKMLEKNRLFTKEDISNIFNCYFSILEDNASDNSRFFVEDSKATHFLAIDIYFTFNKHYSETDFFLFLKLLTFRSFLITLHYLKEKKSSKKELIKKITECLEDEWYSRPKQKGLTDRISEKYIKNLDFSKPFNELMNDVFKEPSLDGLEPEMERRFAYVAQQSPFLTIL